MVPYTADCQGVVQLERTNSSFELVRGEGRGFASPARIILLSGRGIRAEDAAMIEIQQQFSKREWTCRRSSVGGTSPLNVIKSSCRRRDGEKNSYNMCALIMKLVNH